MKTRSRTTLYLIRHGQTPSNARGIQQGIGIDDYLNTQGIFQVQHMAKLIKFLDLDMLFTSYLHRAEETTAIIYRDVGENIPLLHDFRLRERDFGSLTGKTVQEILPLYPAWAEDEQMQKYDYTPFGGENIQNVRERVLSAMLDIIQNYNHKNIGVVTHGGVIRLLLFHFSEITRLYHVQDNKDKDIQNADVYEWVVSESKMDNLKALLEANK